MATWFIRLLLVAVLAVVALAVTVLSILPRATHARAMTVLTGSMTPGIPVGSVVLVRPVDPGTLHVGDVATYQREPGRAEYVTHRIIKINNATTPASFVFKGDANRGPDMEPVPADAIRGRVWFHVPYLGSLRDAMHTRGGLAGLGVLLGIGYALYQLVGAWRDHRTSRAGATAEPGRLLSELESPSVEPRVMMLATLRIDAFDGLAPAVVARLFCGIVVDESEATFSLLVSEREPRSEETLRLLRAFEPLSLECVPPAAPPPAAHAPLIDVTERALAAADA